MTSQRRKPLRIAGQTIPKGQTRDLRLKISETYTGDAISIPIRVIRARKPGPTVFVTAAIHGDEINGTGIVHDLMFEKATDLKAGTLILIPVVNVFGFESHDRYLPDRRNLNRSFPGSRSGSLASRYAWTLMTEIVSHCDFGIDLHTAGSQRTNYPNVRADLDNAKVRKLAMAFGSALVVDGKGPVGSFRREAVRAGCPTIILEAGEPYKIEPSVLEIGIQGVRNILIDLGMISGQRILPPYQSKVIRTNWLRAKVGGILRFHVSVGDLVREGENIATNYSILGEQQDSLVCPRDGIILSIATMPAVKPGEPVCHLAIPQRSLDTLEAAYNKAKDGPYHQARDDLATNVVLHPRES